MVKEQNIALNPAKISGICGRLMCCMSFEHKVYKNLWAGLPGPGSKLKTPKGNYVVAAMDIARETVRCHKPGGGDIAVPIKMFQEFRDAVTRGEEWELPEAAREAEKECSLSKKRDCQCRGRKDFRVVVTADGTENENAPPQRISEVIPQKEASSGDPEQGKGLNQRRGRRGGRRRRQETLSDNVQAEARERPHRASKPQEKTHEAGIGASVQSERPRRPRRRRRGPKPGQSPASNS